MVDVRITLVVVESGSHGEVCEHCRQVAGHRAVPDLGAGVMLDASAITASDGVVGVRFIVAVGCLVANLVVEIHEDHWDAPSRQARHAFCKPRG